MVLSTLALLTITVSITHGPVTTPITILDRFTSWPLGVLTWTLPQLISFPIWFWRTDFLTNEMTANGFSHTYCNVAYLLYEDTWKLPTYASVHICYIQNQDKWSNHNQEEHKVTYYFQRLGDIWHAIWTRILIMFYFLQFFTFHHTEHVSICIHGVYHEPTRTYIMCHVIQRNAQKHTCVPNWVLHVWKRVRGSTCSGRAIESIFISSQIYKKFRS